MEQSYLISYSPFVGVHTLTGSCVPLESIDYLAIIENSNIHRNQHIMELNLVLQNTVA